MRKKKSIRLVLGLASWKFRRLLARRPNDVTADPTADATSAGTEGGGPSLQQIPGRRRGGLALGRAGRRVRDRLLAPVRR